MARTLPNIIITGTPGVGKTTHCQQLAESTGLAHLDINKVVKERGCDDGYDEELKSVIVDEDKVFPLLRLSLLCLYRCPRAATVPFPFPADLRGSVYCARESLLTRGWYRSSWTQ